MPTPNEDGRAWRRVAHFYPKSDPFQNLKFQ